MIRLRTRLKRTLKNGFESAQFMLSSSKNPLKREFTDCHSSEALFGFADTHIGIGQNPDEFLRFLDYTKEKSPSTVCEIGVRQGGTNFMLANALKSCSAIVGVDILLCNIHLLKFFCRPGVTQHFISGYSAEPRTVCKVEKALGERKIDVLFIDGDHCYEGVAKDFKAYRHLVRDGGVIVFHDICMDHRRRYGIETPNDSGEVYLFWQEIRECYQTAEFFTIENQDGAGIGVIVWDADRVIPKEL